MVPPLAASNTPLAWRSAPVNAPRSWPNKVLSTSCPGMPPQLTQTRGPPLRGPWRWIALATSSFPVPVSPWINTGMPASAMRAMVSINERMAALATTTSPSTVAGSATIRAVRASAWRTGVAALAVARAARAAPSNSSAVEPCRG